MNEIEKEIEKDFGSEEEIMEEKGEEESIKKKINFYRDDERKKKIIMISVIIVLALITVGLVVYLVVSNNKDSDKANNDNKKGDVVDTSKDDDKNKDDDNKVSDKISYVSCDDNTAPLNVRSSVGGDITNMISCFKEVDILEELEGTELCNGWYRISYTKNNREYTGYACGKYIKKSDVSSKTMNMARDLIDKANDYYETSMLKPYCGKTSEKKTVTSTLDGVTMEGEYVKSEFKNLTELKNYLLTFMDDSLIKTKLELSDYDKPKYYDDYYEIDGNLYCRNYTGKGWLTYYTGNYDIEITSTTDSKISGNIAYEYLKEDSKCKLNELDKCPSSNFTYELGKFTIDKKNDNYIITKMDFHK